MAEEDNDPTHDYPDNWVTPAGQRSADRRRQIVPPESLGIPSPSDLVEKQKLPCSNGDVPLPRPNLRFVKRRLSLPDLSTKAGRMSVAQNGANEMDSCPVISKDQSIHHVDMDQPLNVANPTQTEPQSVETLVNVPHQTTTQEILAGKIY